MRAFERPLAIAEGRIFMRIIRALDDVAAARHVILTISRTIQLVGIIAAVVLLVALERCIDALAVRAVERTCASPSREDYRSVRYNTESRITDLRDGETYRKDRHWHDT